MKKIEEQNLLAQQKKGLDLLKKIRLEEDQYDYAIYKMRTCLERKYLI